MSPERLNIEEKSLMRHRLSLVQLEAFVRVAQARNFRAAAQGLNVSQPALTRSIKIVEEALGTKVFDRTAHGVELTPNGEMLLPVAERILAELDGSFSDLAQHISGVVGRITIAVLPSVGATILPGWIESFQGSEQRYQFIIHDVRETILLDMLKSGQVDFAISSRPVNSPELIFSPLLKDEFVLVCTRDHDLARLPSASWSVFAEHPFIAGTRDTSVRAICEAMFGREGIPVVPKYETANWSVGGQLVARKLGISAMPKLVLGLTDMARLTTIPLEPTIARSIGALTRSGRTLSAAVRLFLAHAVRHSDDAD
jgi:DNA-binding transcriptional LysR family regulator